MAANLLTFPTKLKSFSSKSPQLWNSSLGKKPIEIQMTILGIISRAVVTHAPRFIQFGNGFSLLYNLNLFVDTQA